MNNNTITARETCAICHSIADYVWLGEGVAMSLCANHFALYSN